LVGSYHRDNSNRFIVLCKWYESMTRRTFDGTLFNQHEPLFESMTGVLMRVQQAA